MTAEWLVTGRPLLRLPVGLLTGLTVLALAGGLLMQPKLRDLHARMYHSATQQQKDQAAKSFRAWHGTSQMRKFACDYRAYLVRLESVRGPGKSAVCKFEQNPELTKEGFSKNYQLRYEQHSPQGAEVKDRKYDFK